MLKTTRPQADGKDIVMRLLRSISSTGAMLVLAGAAVAGAQNPPAPTILYGTTTTLPQANQFAIATTQPTPEKPRSEFVVVAEANKYNDLEVLAWRDTTSSLEAISGHGIANHQDVVTVAVTGLDAHRVVTADVNKSGVLSVHTWSVETAGVVSERGYRSAQGTASPKNVAIATLNCNEVVTAYTTTGGSLIVEAWTIGADGLPAPKALLGKGPKVLESSIATVSENRVVTASGDSAQSLWVTTWEITSAGVKSLDTVQKKDAISSTQCYVVPRLQQVAVGAGSSAGSPHSAVVQAAFTPVLAPGCQLEAYSWDISNSGTITLKSTTAPPVPEQFDVVAASMLPRNIPMFSGGGGTGDDFVFAEVYSAIDILVSQSVASYNDPFSVVNIASTDAGTDLNRLSLFNPYHAYFVSAGLFNGEGSSTEGTLFLNVLSYPEAPVL
jgi:hypothetical protein